MKKIDFFILLILTGIIIAQQPSLEVRAGVIKSSVEKTLARFEIKNNRLLDSLKAVNKSMDSLNSVTKFKLYLLKTQQKTLSKQVKTIDTLLTYK